MDCRRDVLDEVTLRSQLKKFNKQPFPTGKKQFVEQRLDASSKMERELLYLMLSSNILIPKALEEIGLEEFTNKDFQQIAEKVVELYHKNNVVKAKMCYIYWVTPDSIKFSWRL